MDDDEFQKGLMNELLVSGTFSKPFFMAQKYVVNLYIFGILKKFQKIHMTHPVYVLRIHKNRTSHQ